MRPVTLPVLLTCLCLCCSCTGVGAYEVLIWLNAGCGCSYSVNEQSESLEVCAEILFICDSDTTTSEYTVTISTVDVIDSAISGVDYEPLSSHLLTFPEDSSQGDSLCTTISIIDDIAVENTESFRVDLATSDAEVAFSSICPSAPVNIFDSDEITVEVTEQTMAINHPESSGAVEVCLIITHGILERTISSSYRTRSGTATDSRFSYSDYRYTSSSVSFASESTVGNTECISVSVTDETTVENDEIFYVDFSSRSGLTVNSAARSASITILDDDVAVIGMTSSRLSQLENTVDISVCVLLLLSQRVEITLTAFVTTQDITATGGSDYNEFANIGISFDSTGFERCANVRINEDAILEYDETFEIVLTENSPKLEIETGRATTEITIMEDGDGVTIGFQSTFHFTGETAGPLIVCARMFAGNLEREVSMTLVSSDGTAVAPGDYEDLNTQLVFGIGVSTGAVACADLLVTDDNVVEEDYETLTLTMSADDPPVTTTTALTAIVYIGESDNDVADSVALTSTNFDAFESNRGVNICVVFNATELERSLTVLLSSQDGTATNVADYTAFQFVPFTFLSGAQAGEEQCHFTPVVDDDILENSESFSVTLFSSEPAFLESSSTQATVTINADPADIVELAFQSDVYSGTEQLPLRNDTICVDIIMGILERDVIVNLEATNGTAESGVDYTGPTPSEVTFRAGLSAGDQRCIVVTVIDDDFIEDEETFDIVLTVSPGDEPSVVFNGADVTTFTIIQDPNDRAIVQLQRERVNGTEGQNISVCTVLSSISGDVRRPLLINVAVTSASADIGVDFDAISPTTVIFPRNSSSGDVECITIELLTDRFLEVPENFVTNLNTDDPAVTVDLAADLTIITIFDVPDPNAVGVTFMSLDLNVTEGDPFVEVCVEIVVGTVSEEGTVEVETISGTATADSDFEPLIGSVRFYPNETVGAFGCVHIPVIDDSIVEEDETFTVTLTSAGVIQAIGDTMTTVTIFEDSDIVLLGLQAAELIVMENETFSVCVEITEGSLERNVSIGLVAENSSNAQATVTEDYLSLDTNITFTSGQSATGDNQQCFSITILNDNVLECSETFDLFISPIPEDEDVVSITRQVLTVIIEDTTDFVDIRLLPEEFSVSENETFPVCAKLSAGSVDCDVSIALDTQLGSATAGVDFTGPDPPLLTFTPGQSVGDIQCANITVVDDSIPQPERSIVVTLGNNRTVGGIESISSVRVNTSIPSLSFDIDPDINDLLQVKLSQLIYKAVEGANDVIICVVIDQGFASSNTTLQVNTTVSVTSTATPDSDFLPTLQVLTFTAGQSTNDTACASVTIVKDVLVEAVETFEVTLFPTAADLFKVLIISGQDKGIVAISDGETHNSVEVQPSSSTVTATERCSSSIGDDCAEVMVCLELVRGNLGRNVSVTVQTVSLPTSTAKPDVDYVSFESNITFTSGQSATGDNQQCVFITLLDDDVLEGNESFAVLITPAPGDEGVVFINSTDELITVIIQEDPNDNVQIGLPNTRFTVTESVDSTIMLCAELQVGSLEREVSVAIVTEGSNATVGVDYLIEPDTLTFTAGQSAFDGLVQCTNITILDDEDTEPRESVIIFLKPAEGDATAVVIQPISVTTINIIEDPSDGTFCSNYLIATVTVNAYRSLFVEVQISPLTSVQTVTEGGTANVCIGVSLGSLQTVVRVNVRTITSIASTATPGEDFTLLSKTVTLDSNDPVCNSISILDDDIMEECEAFLIDIEVQAAFSGIAVVPNDVDKMVILIEDDLMDATTGTNNRTVTVAIYILIVVVFVVVIAVAVVIAACCLIKCRKKKGAVVYTNDQALEESEKKLPIVIDEDSKSKMVETAALW